MKQLFLANIFLFSTVLVSAQSASNHLLKNDNYNLDFEKLIPNTNRPLGWFGRIKTDEISIETDTVEKYTGNRSMVISNSNLKSQAYTQSGIVIPSKYKGSEIEIKFYAKLKDVTNHVDFIIRTNDVDNDRLQYKNSLEKRIFGTSDWKEYSLKVPLESETHKVWFWPTLYGSGKLWIDNVSILIDGKDINIAKLKPDFNPDAKGTSYGNNADVGKKVKVKDAEIYYETYGDGEPLLLLHGNSQSINVFKKQIKEFSKNYKVIVVDTRGQGKSTDLSQSPLTYDLFADDMKTLLDSLHISKAHILGWSDGGNTGLIMAYKYPSYVNKLAVMGACTNPNDAVSEATLKEVESAYNSLAQKTDEQSKKQARLFKMLLTEPHITLNDLKLIKSQVLVMAGEKDMILEKHTKYIASNITNGKLLIFKGAGHYAPVEIVSEFNNAVLNFLNSK